MKLRLSINSTIILCTMILAFAVSACVDDVPLDNATCPCLDGYECCDGVCKEDCLAVPHLEGKKYILDLGSAYWTEPSALMGVDDFWVYAPVFAFKILEVDPSAMTFSALLGTTKNGTQDLCYKTYLMPGTLENQYKDDVTMFTLGPTDIQSILYGPESCTVAGYHGFTLTGQFVDHGAGYETGTLEVVMDTSEIYPIFNASDATTGEELCEDMLTVNVVCEECAFEPGTNLCLTFIAEEFSVAGSPELKLTEITDPDAECI